MRLIGLASVSCGPLALIRLALSIIPVVFLLGGASSAALAQSSADPGIDFSSGSYGTSENLGQVEITLTPRESAPFTRNAELRFGRGTDTADEGVDYIAPGLSFSDLEWGPGDSSPRSFIIEIPTNSPDDEGRESFSIDLIDRFNDFGGAMVSTTVAIAADTSTSNPGVFDISVPSASVSEGIGSFLISVARSGGTDGAVTVTLGSAGSATQDEDYRGGPGVTGNLDWADGEGGAKTVQVLIEDDELLEGNETFTVSIDSVSNGGVIGSSGSVDITIVDNDQGSVFSFVSDTFTGSEQELKATISVNRTGANSTAATVVLSFEGGSADPGTDFTDDPLLVRWDAGEVGMQSVDIPITNDDEVEGPETFSVFFDDTASDISATDSFDSPGFASVSIQDDDRLDPGVISFSSDGFSALEDSGQLTISLDRTGGSDIYARATVEIVASEPLSAVVGQDYNLPASFEVDWGTQETGPKTLTIPLLPDLIPEANETFIARIQSVDVPDTALMPEIGSPAQATLTIINDDEDSVQPGSFALSSSTYSVAENAGPASIAIQRTGGSDGEVAVAIGIEPGTAGVPDDFEPPQVNSVTFADEQDGLIMLEIPITNDTIAELDEDFTVFITEVKSEFDGADSSDDPSTVTITDDDPPPAAGVFTLSSTDYSVLENNGPLVVEITRTGGSDGAASVTLELTPDTAGAPEDFSAAPLTAEWTADDVEPKMLSIPIVPDESVEPDETFQIAIGTITSEVPGATNGGVTATATIENDDRPARQSGFVALSSPTYSVAENTGPAVISVQRANGSEGELTVLLGVEPDTATTPEDYVDPGQAWSVTLPAGQTTADASIALVNDEVDEDDERFTVFITGVISEFDDESGFDGVGFADDPAIVTIVNDDAPVPAAGVFTLSEQSYTVAENQGPLAIDITRTGGSDGEASVTLELTPGTATAPQDYSAEPLTASWEAGDADTQTLFIPIEDDEVFEDDETFQIALGTITSEVPGATNGGVTATATITDDDLLPATGTVQFAAATYTAIEGQQPLEVQVTRTGGSAGEVSVRYAVSGTAENDPRVTVTGPNGSTDKTLTWADADVTPRTVQISVAANETIDEPVELVLELQEEPQVVLSRLQSLFAGFLGRLTHGAASQPGTRAAQTRAPGDILGDNALTTVTIIDETVEQPGDFTFSAERYSQAEDAGPIVVTVQRTGGDDGEVNVAVRTTGENDGSNGDLMRATAGEDYTPTEVQLEWVDDDSDSKSFSIPVNTDDLVELDEGFEIELTVLGEFGEGNDGTVLNPTDTAEVIIENDDIPETGELAFNPDTYSAREDDGTVTVLVARTGGSDGPASVAWAIAGGTATLDADYAVPGDVGGTLNWPAGDAQPRAIEVALINDLIEEGDETIVLTLADASGATLGSASSATITLEDTTDLVSDSVSLAAGPVTLNEEDAGTVSVTVRRVGTDTRAASVAYEIRPGSAQPGEDYEAQASGEISWAAGERDPQTIDITVLDDDLDEPDEAFTLALVEPDNLTLGNPSTRRFTIVDDDDPPVNGTVQFLFADITVPEDVGTVSLVVTRTGGSDGAITAGIRTEAIGATAGADFTPVGDTLSWADGDVSSRTVSVPILTDTLTEALESFRVILEPIQDAGVIIGTPASVLVTIDDVPPPTTGTVQWAASGYTVAEDAQTLQLTATRVGGADGALSSSYASADRTATAGDDYARVAGTLRWADGDDSARTVEVAILSDTLAEPDEQFALALSNAQPAGSLGEPALALVTITDVIVEEPPEPLNPGEIRFADDSGVVSEADGRFAIRVERTGGADGVASVAWNTVAGTATAGRDFDAATGTLQWADGDATARVIELVIAQDSELEPTETLSVALSDARGARSGVPDTFTLNIEDATDPLAAGRLEFAQTALSVEEAAGQIVLEVRRIDGTSGPVSVNYDTTAETATEGADFEPVTGTLNWADGDDTVRRITVPVVADSLVEANEFFAVSLSGAEPFGNDQLGAAQARVTLLDSTNPGTLSVRDAAINASEADGTAAVVVVREGGADGPVGVAYTLVSDSAEVGVDVAEATGRLEWADGDDTARTVTLDILADALVENDEQVQFVLSDAAPVGDAQIGTGTAILTITDSTDIGRLVVSETEVLVEESDNVAVVTVSREGGTDGPLSVEYRTIAGTALASADYTGSRGQLTWADGETGSKQISVPILADQITEVDDESLVLRLENTQPEPDLLGNETLDVTITIRGVGPINDDIDTSGYRLVILEGNGQGGLPGDQLDPMMLQAQDAAGNPVAATVYWSVVPTGSAELLDGDETMPDAEGITSQRVSILSRGFLNVVASLAPPVQAGDPASDTLGTRVDAPPFEAGAGDAVFTIRAGIGAAEGLSSNASRTGFALDQACEALQAADAATLTPAQLDLLAICSTLDDQVGDQEGDNGLEESLARLAPEEVFYVGESVIETGDIQVTNVYARINAIRSGRVDAIDLAGLSLTFDEQRIPGSVLNAAEESFSGGGASADGEIAPVIGVFANGTISFGDVDGDGIEADADFSTRGLTLGADYRLSDNGVIGAALGLFVNNTDFTTAGGEADMDGTNLSLFGTWYEEATGYVDVVLDIGRNAYDITRRVSFPDADDRFVAGSTDASAVSLTLGIGRDFSLNQWDIGPYGRLSIIRADVDGYRESSTDGLPNGATLDIKSHKVNSSTISVGGQVSRNISTRQGVFIPQFRLEAEFENDTRKEDIVAVFENDPTQTPFSVSGNKRDNAYVNLGLGASALLKNGRSGYLFYETQLAHDTITQHWVKAGVRLEF